MIGELLNKVNSPNNKNIFLTGFMGSGKTTVGKLLASQLEIDFIDLDTEIEKYLDQSISDTFKNFGEQYFRKIENQQLAMLCKKRNTVIALGGGSLLTEKNQSQILKSGVLVYLMADEKTLMNRLEKSYKRPLLDKGFLELYEERNPGYLLAELSIRTDKFSPDKIAELIANELNFYEK